MKFRTYVEPPEPMRGLEVPPAVVESLGQGKRPRVTITINGHSWESRVAIMRGRYLHGLSKANRQAAGVVTGDEVEVELEFDPEVSWSSPLTSPAPSAPTRSHAAPTTACPTVATGSTCAIESAKKPETRMRRIEKALATLRDLESGGRAATQASKA
jgi:hypothetical protein